ncbi:trypsin-like serine protease [Staphylococcus sp. 11007852]|uniref:trypsin-like serine peptidase n=1 Tax=Staphylococcus TaxID=1279 RepID=UPI000D041EFB|nr:MULTISPECIES: trypsin-like peptidase domain-containing protein [Staphylococcus]NHM75018.1 trypsin-like serine protease [Staphylococcus sp. 11007852]NJH68432.1 trypsin-like serine protease [Staphylococcus agnetis]NJH83978.1 trypsin-like serine protease [Staphylococcus agnetis]
MIKKILILSIVIFLPITNEKMSDLKANENHGKQVIVTDTTKDPIGKRVAKFEKDGHHCTATMINSKVGITSSHCSDNNFEDNANGRLYPAESALKTPFGYMDITLFNPYDNGNKLYDIALIGGKESNKSSDYKFYGKEFDIAPVKVMGIRNINDLVGEEVYSFGYPYEKSGYVQYRSEGTITHTDQFNLYSDIPSYPGQSGSAVFLKKNNQLIGIIHGGVGTRTSIKPITSEISNWFNDKSNNWLENDK